MTYIKQTIMLCLLCMIGMMTYAEEIPNDEIWYTSSEGSVVQPDKFDVFGATIISNTYSDGKGVIKFDGNVTSIGDYAFDYCSGLTSITIPNSVEIIGARAFYGCSSLTSITIPNSVTSTGGAAFHGCSSLTSITIPNSVTSIGDWTFSDCSDLTSITIPNSVTSIGEGAFSGCSDLTSIEIPNSVTSIESSAFEDCSGLTSITIPNSVTSIGNFAFEDCSGLTSIEIPNSVTSIGDYAFYFCSGLTSITIPNSVTSIGDYAFSYCSSLTSIEIPNSVTSIGAYAFEYCSSLTSITIPNSVTSIGESAFEYCSSLTSIEIPNSVTSIGKYAFGDCSSLTSIIIPNSVKSIGEYAFYGCSSLKNIYVSWKEPLYLSTILFSDIDYSKCVLYVPVGTSSLYASANVWKEFQHIVESEPKYNMLAADNNGNEVNKPVASGDNVTIDDTYQSLSITEDIDNVNISYSRTYKNTSWQAWYVPFEMTYTSGVEQSFSFGKFAGTYTDDDGNFYITIIRLKPGDFIKANTSYFVKAKTANTTSPQVITVNGTNLKTTTSSSFLMHSAEKEIKVTGLYNRKTATTDDMNWYYFSGGQYCLPNVGTTLGAFRFHLTISDREDNPYGTQPNPVTVKIMEIDEMDDVTGIESQSLLIQDGMAYDLSGRMVTNPRHGVYIINGKKIFIQ